MKNIIILSALFVSLGITSTVSAAVVDPSVTNGNPYEVVNGWGLTGTQSKYIAPGTTVTDKGGVTGKCATWEMRGCYDITVTKWYEENMIALAKQLLANGFSTQFPQFSYWYGLAR